VFLSRKVLKHLRILSITRKLGDDSEGGKLGQVVT